MSRKVTKSILSRDEISLLINSEQIKNVEIHGNLYNVLSKLEKYQAITLDELIENGLDKNGITLLTKTKGKLIEDITHEWYVENKSAEDTDKKIRCGLCNTPNRYLFYIRNRLNHKQLNVGSSCMKKFPEIEGYTNHKYELGKIQRNQQQTARWLKFHNKFPDAESIIDSAQFYFDNLPILLPYKIYSHLEEVVNLLHIIYIKYVKYGKIPDGYSQNAFDLFDEILNKYNSLKIKSDNFVKNNINKQFICKRSEIDWMKQTKKELLLKKISLNDGQYTIETIGDIVSVDFIIQNFDIFNNKIPSKFIKLIPLKDKYSSLQFTIKQDGEYLYDVNIKKFMKQIGAKCFFDSKYKICEEDLFRISKLAISNKNLEHIIELIKYNLSKTGYALLIDDYTDNLYLYNKSRKDIKEFTSSNFLHIYDLNKIKKHKNDKEFIGFLLTYKKWIPLEEQERMGSDEKIHKLYYQQYIEPYK